jgi:hypothetical protein
VAVSDDLADTRAAASRASVRCPGFAQKIVNLPRAGPSFESSALVLARRRPNSHACNVVAISVGLDDTQAGSSRRSSGLANLMPKGVTAMVTEALAQTFPHVHSCYPRSEMRVHSFVAASMPCSAPSGHAGDVARRIARSSHGCARSCAASCPTNTAGHASENMIRAFETRRTRNEE